MRLLTTTEWTVKRGMLLAGVVVAVCALTSFYLTPLWLFILATVLAVSCVIPFLRHPIWLYIAVWGTAFLCLFGTRRLLSVDPTCRLAGQPDTITARVVELPASGHMVTVEVLDAYKLSRGDRVLLYCNEQVMPKRDETVTAQVELKELYPTQRRYRADGVFLQAYPIGYEEQAMTIVSPPPSWRTVLSSLRERVLGNIRERLSGEEGALLAGICLGEKNDIPDSAMTAFRRAGLPHILVVSGLHLSIISTGVFGLLWWLLPDRRLAAALTMASVGLFMAIIGFTPSVVRAGVMCLTMLGGQLFTRRADGLNSMGLALMILLAANPYSLLDVGLQLSFGAAGGVLCLARPLEARLCACRVWKPLASGLSVTLAASLPILPLLGYCFGEVSVVSPLANLLAVASAGVALIFGWVGALLALLPPLAFLANGVLYLAGWIARWLLAVAHIIGGLPVATVEIDRVWTILYLTGGCVLGILCIYKAKRGMLRRMTAVMAAFLVLACGADRMLHRGTTVVAVSTHADSAVLLVEQDGRHGLLVQDVAGIYVNDAFVRACDGELDFVMIGDGETADAAYLTDLLRQVAVGHIYVGEGAAFTKGLALTASTIQKNSEIKLWTDTSLLVDEQGTWQLSCRGATLAITPELYAADENETMYLTTRGGEWSVKRWR